jgi:hypothetical protein
MSKTNHRMSKTHHRQDPQQPLCPHGSKCYRTSPEHIRTMHPRGWSPAPQSGAQNAKMPPVTGVPAANDKKTAPASGAPFAAMTAAHPLIVLVLCPASEPHITDIKAAASLVEAPALTAPSAGTRSCPYGTSCYRRNPAHKAKYHATPAATCPYGTSCYRRNPAHQAKYHAADAKDSRQTQCSPAGQPTCGRERHREHTAAGASGEQTEWEISEEDSDED